MDKKEIMKWAIYGLETKLENLDTRIRKGRKMLTDIENRLLIPSKKEPKEHISNLLRQDLSEYEILDKKRHDLQWELTLMEQDEK